MNESDDILSDSPWPQGDRLVTDGGHDGHTTAQSMHDSGDRWSVHATGYHMAADVVVDRIKEGFGNEDCLVYPVMALYRHSLELRISNLIQLAWRLLDKAQSEDLHSHNLLSLWQLCRLLLESAAPGDSLAEFGHVGKLIEEFCHHDAGLYAFRYPLTNPDPQTQQRSAILRDMNDVDLRKVQTVMANVSALLMAAEAALDYDLQNKAELLLQYLPGANDHY